MQQNHFSAMCCANCFFVISFQTRGIVSSSRRCNAMNVLLIFIDDVPLSCKKKSNQNLSVAWGVTGLNLV